MTRQPASLFVVGLCLGLALSGCFGSKDHKASPTASSTSGMGNNNTTKLQAVIVVTYNGTELTPQNGTLHAVAGTNLTFDATQSTGLTLSWKWEFGDNATSEDPTVVHVYAAPGKFNASLTVTAGNNTSTAYVELNVTRAPGTLVWTFKKDFTGTLTAGNPNAPTTAGVDYNDHAVVVAGTDANGSAVMAKRVRINLDSSSATAIGMYAYWRTATTSLATSNPGQSAHEKIDYKADNPAGNYVARARLFAGANVDYTMHVEIDYFSV